MWVNSSRESSANIVKFSCSDSSAVKSNRSGNTDYMKITQQNMINMRKLRADLKVTLTKVQNSSLLSFKPYLTIKSCFLTDTQITVGI